MRAVVTGDSDQSLEWRIESVIRDNYQVRGWRVVWPFQFTDPGLGTEREVVKAMKNLVDSGKLRDEVLIRCPNGHEVWRGRPSDLPPSGYPWVCADCDAGSGEGDFDLFLRFSVSDRWAGFLNEEKKTQQ